MMKFVVSRLDDLPFDLLEALVIESEQEGWRFLRRLVDEWISGANRFAEPGEALFAAGSDQKIVGVCGLNIDPYVNDSTIGRVRRLYVAHSSRSQGVGHSLVQAVVQYARGRFQLLRVRTENYEAGRLYENIGFTQVIDVSKCTHSLELK